MQFLEYGMKKILSLTLLSLLLLGGYASARNVYDINGHTLYDDTIRGKQRATAQAKLNEQKKIQAAAAAKITEETMENLDAQTKKSNYIQSKNGEKRDLPDSTLKSNYIQSRYR